VWCWWNASGDFSASLFLCLKYLPASDVSAWLRSALEIESPHWRAQLIVWLIGAHKVLCGDIHWPSEFELSDYPYVGWAWSHCLRRELLAASAAAESDLLPEDNRRAALETIRAEVTAARYDAWWSSISKVDYLVTELGDLPDEFRRLYLTGMRA
jgi:hypothetical protein